MKEFDVIIIGFGKGGKTIALEFAKRNKSVAIIERSDKMYGGTCINIGCIPTKTLVHQAKIAYGMKDVSFDEKREFYRNAISLKDNVTGTLRNKNYHNLADNPNITVCTGEGTFVSSDTIAVEMKDEKILLKSSNIIINTGAKIVIPPIKGVQGNPYVYTSTSIMELTELPRRLVIIGGGYIGLEFASMFASFGTKVTVLENNSELIPLEDRDVAASVKETLEKKGIEFRLNVSVKSITEKEGEASVLLSDLSDATTTLEAEAVLLAIGRRPDTERLHLEMAGVNVDARGAIIVDEYLKTSNPHIRAVGDVKGGLQFTYISLDDYRIIREDMFGEKSRKTSDRNLIGYSVFIDPPLSRIGINEDDARRKGLDVIIKKIPVSAIPRAKTLGESEGMLKAVIDKKTNLILGCTLFAPDSSEVINIVTLAMKMGESSTFLRDFIFTHPSMSEALNDLFN